MIPPLLHLSKRENLAQGWTDPGVSGDTGSKPALQNHLIQIVLVCF